MLAPQFRELKIKDLKNAHYNPPNRIQKDRIGTLVASIGKIGLLYPILVTKDNVIIDGHRRVAAYKELGLETIPAIVGSGDPNELYASVNATSRKMGGNESLVIFLKEPSAVEPSTRTRIENMLGELGMVRVQRLAKEGMSLQVYQRSRMICAYCDQDYDMVPQIFDWVMDTQGQQTVRAAMVSGVPGTIIMKAVRAGKPLKVTMAVAS